MTPDELKRAAIEIWGEKGWITSLASALSVDRTQVWRWVNGNTQSVPGPVSAAVSCWLARLRDTGRSPPAP